MQLRFVKYQATGNDFIVLNNLTEPRRACGFLDAQQLCHRQFGIGADGVLSLEPKAGFDFALLHRNADGSAGGGLCGNGSRAALHYAHQLGIFADEARFWALDGAHVGSVRNGLVSLELRDVATVQRLESGYFVDNGTRHHVELVEELEAIDLQAVGFPRRYLPPFAQQGVNLNFVQRRGRAIGLRTCECGLDVEPLSCGTGAVAGALVAHLCYGLGSPIEVQTRGGVLWVAFRPTQGGLFSSVVLTGPAVQTFAGAVDVPHLAAHWPKHAGALSRN